VADGDGPRDGGTPSGGHGSHEAPGGSRGGGPKGSGGPKRGQGHGRPSGAKPGGSPRGDARQGGDARHGGGSPGGSGHGRPQAPDRDPQERPGLGFRGEGPGDRASRPWEADAPRAGGGPGGQRHDDRHDDRHGGGPDRRSYPPRPAGPRRDGPPVRAQRRDAPPAHDQARPAYGPRRDGPPVHDQRRNGPPAFGPRRDGPPAYDQRRDGPRPQGYGPRRDGPPAYDQRPAAYGAGRPPADRPRPSADRPRPAYDQRRDAPSLNPPRPADEPSIVVDAHDDEPAPDTAVAPPFRPAPRFDRRPGPDRRPYPGAGRPPMRGVPRYAPARPPGIQDPSLALRDEEELVAGRRPVEEAFVARREARRLLVVPQRRMALEKLVLHATSLRIPVVEVEGGTLTAIAGFDGHQGIALVVAPRRFASPDEILALAAERAEPPLVLVLDSLEDPQNVGTLLRSAEATGVHGAVFPTHRQAPLSPAAIKASAGATEHLRLAPVDDLPGALADLHIRGLRIVGADGDATLTAREADLRGPIAIVVGSEGRGLGPAVRRRCDLLVRIPMHGRIESLNAAVAGSILLYEAAAQRRLPEAPPRSRPDDEAQPGRETETDLEPASETALAATTGAPATDEPAKAPEPPVDGPVADAAAIADPAPGAVAPASVGEAPAKPKRAPRKTGAAPVIDAPAKPKRAPRKTVAAPVIDAPAKPKRAPRKTVAAPVGEAPAKPKRTPRKTGALAAQTAGDPAAEPGRAADDDALLPGGPVVALVEAPADASDDATDGAAGAAPDV